MLQLLFSQRKEREDPEEEQDRLTELLNSTSSVGSEVTVTLETSAVELLFSQRKEREDPEEEQDRLTELLNSTSSVGSEVTTTLVTSAVGGKHRGLH
ncbi:hypothetical protein F7725_018023 [Dissostichus mawsoni]|uniref:Uncharacterized protein n=1 Tax=Dissostichus mawsoni TaxID=36200 RepID=A0A7J5XQA3_DISMA|nr:hypothetical protein F7725_018023 [Dissostichus mawsoni]